MKANTLTPMRSSSAIGRRGSDAAHLVLVGLAVLFTAAGGIHLWIPPTSTTHSHLEPHEGIMREPHNLGDLDIQAAKAALLFLYSSLPDAPAVAADYVRVLPSDQIISVDEAARVLAAMEKPVECFAEAQDGVLVIECSAVSEEERRFDREFADATLKDLLGRKWKKIASQSQASVILSGRDKALMLSVPTLVAFYHDYALSVPARLQTDPATAAERKMGLVLKAIVERFPEGRHFAIDRPQ